MNILSFSFIGFCILLVSLYFIVPQKLQHIVLLLFSMYFYMNGGVWAIGYILTTTVVTFIAAIALDEINKKRKKEISAVKTIDEKSIIRLDGVKEKRYICFIALISVFGIWVVFKYSAFLITSLNDVFSFLHLYKQLDVPCFFMPLGISFYTFHASGYMIDVYRGKYSAERSFLKYALFISFFPHIIQGPFSRYDRLGKTLFANHSFSYDRMCLGLRRILWGYTKKLLVADKISIFVSEIFSRYEEFPGIYICVAMLGYGIQLYADFSGYMDIMCGLCQVLGIELSENFRQPYFSKSIEEFWQRWHITLGTWFKDYVFSPVAMGKMAQKIGHHSRKKFGARMGKYIPGYFALIFVWTLTGLWHGANWTYIVWGWLNLFVIIFSMQFKPIYEKIKKYLHISNDNKLWKLFQICRTFGLVCLFRFFSYENTTVKTAFAVIRKIGYNNYSLIKKPFELFLGVSTKDIYVFLVGILIIFLVDIYKENKLQWKIPMGIRTVGYSLLLVALILFAGGDNDLVKGFMYAQF